MKRVQECINEETKGHTKYPGYMYLVLEWLNMHTNVLTPSGNTFALHPRKDKKC